MWEDDGADWGALTQATQAFGLTLQEAALAIGTFAESHKAHGHPPAAVTGAYIPNTQKPGACYPGQEMPEPEGTTVHRAISLGGIR